MTPHTTFARRLFMAFAALSFAFVCATLVASWLSYGIEARSDVIAGSALPSIQRLSAACDALRDIEAASDDYPELSAANRHAAQQEIERMWRQVDSDLAFYLALPKFPGEHELYEPEIPAALRSVSTSLARLFVLADSSNGAAWTAADDEVRDATTHANKLLRGVINFNADRVQEQVRRIILTHQSSARNALVLDGAAVLVGLTFFLWVLRQFNSYDMLLKAHATEVEHRADELEVFGARVAHDLLSPLSALAFTLNAFKKISEGDPKLQAAMSRARSCVLRAQRMVDGIFAFARAGGKPQPGARADLREALDRVADEIRLDAATEPPTVVIEPFADCAVACTPAVVGGILANIMHNAVKYMSDSAVQQITVRVHDRADTVRVEIADTGPGIPRDIEGTLFEPYVRASGVTQPGLGLGLATVKRFCEAYGGSVGVWSALGSGATFWFTLPKAPAGSTSEGPSAS
jgi:signal transduction histidine kinase